MRCEVRIRLLGDDDRPFMGIGLLWLLQGIARHRSIRGAAAEMSLSYPKALRMLRDVEEGLGRLLVRRSRGGARRGGAELTADAEDFIARYDSFQAEVKAWADRAFKDRFPELHHG